MLQDINRATDDEDRMSQATSASYSSVAPLGLHAGDAGTTETLIDYFEVIKYCDGAGRMCSIVFGTLK